MRRSVELGLEQLARLDLTLDNRPVGECEREPARRFVTLRLHPHELRMALAVDEPSVAVDEPEAAVSRHAGARQLDVVAVDYMQRLDRRDADTGDPALHAANLAIRAHAPPRPRRRAARCCRRARR